MVTGRRNATSVWITGGSAQVPRAASAAGVRSRTMSEYTTGMTTSVSSVDTVMPPITVIAIGVRTSAPSPNPSAIGTSPRIVLTVVMTIGRKRARGGNEDRGVLVQAALARAGSRHR